MRKRIVLLGTALALLCGACTKPTDIVFGPEPLKQFAEQGDKFKTLPEQDRVLLAQYLTANAMGNAFGAKNPPVIGRTVGEVLADARAWQAKYEAEKAAEAKRDNEAEVLRAQATEEAAALKKKTDEERRQIIEKIAAAVVVAVTDKKVLPKDFDAGRFAPMLTITLALQNNSTQAIKQIKGRAVFLDATGDKIGDLPIDVDAVIQPGKTLKTDMGHGWRMNEFMSGEIEKIASRDFASMKVSFEPTALAFADGTVLRTPE